VLATAFLRWVNDQHGTDSAPVGADDEMSELVAQPRANRPDAILAQLLNQSVLLSFTCALDADSVDSDNDLLSAGRGEHQEKSAGAKNRFQDTGAAWAAPFETETHRALGLTMVSV
jgi:hypothetical protein